MVVEVTRADFGLIRYTVGGNVGFAQFIEQCQTGFQNTFAGVSFDRLGPPQGICQSSASSGCHPGLAASLHRALSAAFYLVRS